MVSEEKYYMDFTVKIIALIVFMLLAITVVLFFSEYLDYRLKHEMIEQGYSIDEIEEMMEN